MSDRFMSFSFLTWKVGMMVFILPILHNYKKFIHSFFSPHSEFGKIYKLQNAVMWEAGLLFHGTRPIELAECGAAGRGGMVRLGTCLPALRPSFPTSEVLHCELETVVVSSR